MIQLKEKDNWEWKPLKYIFNYFLSSVDRKIKDEELNVHICHYPDVYKNEKISDKDTLNKGTCTEFELENFKLMKGDILITKDSEDPKDIGIPCLVENDLIDSVCGYHIGILRTNENIEREFYFRYIQSTDVKDYFFCESNGITRFGLGKSSVENLKIPILSIQEQKIISQYLDKKTKQIDSLIEKIEKKIELLKEQKTALINQCFTKGLNPNVEKKDSGFDWIGEIPSHWEVSKLKFLVFENQESLSNSTNPDLELDYIEISDVNSIGEFNQPTKYKFSESPSRCRRICRKGDVIISTVRTYLKSIGIIEEQTKNLICSTGFSVLTPKSEYLSKYIFYMLRSNWFISKVISKSEGVGYPSIKSHKLLGTEVIIMEKKEQQKIVDYLDIETQKIDQIILVEKKRIDLLKEYKKSLISEVVTGKKRVV